MPSFPQTNELPYVLHTGGWDWEIYKTPESSPREFWLGIDNNGCKWLTKLRGDFLGYREVVFSRLAQRMGWSCQTSIFVQLDDNALKILNIDQNHRIHAAHWFMDEHKLEKCSENCPLPFLEDGDISIGKLKELNIPTILDWPKKDYASILFGAGESSDILLTKCDEIVIIDAEQMFSSPITLTTLFKTHWCNNSKASEEFKIKVCQDLLALSEYDLDECLKLPEDIGVNTLWSVPDCVTESRRYAKLILDSSI